MYDCLELPLEPPERADQERINRLYEMQEAEVSISYRLEEYKHLFPQEIKNFLDDVRMAVWDYEQEEEE